MKELQFCTINGRIPQTHRIELNDQEYSELSNAREILSRVFNHEELYDQVIESYIDAKSVMYEMSIRSISDGVMGDYIRSHNCRSKLNRLYFNTLNLSKLYLDRHYHERDKKSFVKSITRLESSHDEVRQHRQQISNDNANYVLGCDLRNYVQHASLPVKTFTSGVRFDPKDNQNFAVFHIPLDRKALIDGGIKKNKLSKYGDNIDLHEIMDGYIYAISEMHIKSRNLTSNYVEKSIEIITTKRCQIELEYSGLQYGIDVVDTEKEERLFSLHLEWFDVVKHLQEKNSYLLNFKNFTHIPYQRTW
ncbi:hypothetical protein M2G94_10355 [Vibrio vulnificus]|nr:hypothetical protein [Vibrio vulnificus]